MILLPLLVFWSLAIWGMVSQRPVLLYLLFATMPFGALAVVPTALSAGLTLTPTPMLALLLICKHFSTARHSAAALRSASAPSGLLLIFLFWVVAVIATLFMPRIFSGQIEVVPMRSVVTDLLQPTKQNISQLAYVSISVLSVFVLAGLLTTAAMRQHAMKALFLGGAVTVITGLLDFLSLYLPIQPLLEPFRTASYALATEVQFLGGKRVVGLMPEASAFGAVCIAFLASIYFFRHAVESDALQKKAAPVLLAMLLLLTWLSTSSAAYVSLALLIAMAVLQWLWRLMVEDPRRPASKGLATELLVGLAFLAFIALAFLVNPHQFDLLIQIVDKMVLQKSSSGSFDERTMWTAVSWRALLGTYGLGVGLGGTRASSTLVAVAACTGVLGALCFYAFVVQTLLRRAPVRESADFAMLSALRWSYLPSVAPGLLAGVTADFGIFGAFQFSLAAAIGSDAIWNKLQVASKADAEMAETSKPIPG